jgi:hypothetical protein
MCTALVAAVTVRVPTACFVFRAAAITAAAAVIAAATSVSVGAALLSDVPSFPVSHTAKQQVVCLDMLIYDMLIYVYAVSVGISCKGQASIQKYGFSGQWHKCHTGI